jgi:RNase H-fold protein (predicted Holliday junction resolvase)
MQRNIKKDSPKILGLDVSTKTIGWSLFDIESGNLLELTHISPIPKPKVENKIEELLLKGKIFREKLESYKGMGIQYVVIEEPLLNSNNVYTVNSRKFAFPHLVQPNDKDKYVLFGGMPKDIDKKVVIWELVAKREPQITWQYTKNNTLKKENFDQTDAYCAALGFMKMKEIW